MTEQHCGTRLVKGMSFKFDEENKRVYLSPSFYFDHLRNVRESMTRKLDEIVRAQGVRQATQGDHGLPSYQ